VRCQDHILQVACDHFAADFKLCTHTESIEHCSMSLFVEILHLGEVLLLQKILQDGFRSFGPTPRRRKCIELLRLPGQ